MGCKQLQSDLQQAFITDGHRMVFWCNPPDHFVGALNELSLDGVQLFNLEGQSTFGEELKEPGTPTLLYFPYAELAPEDDWLLDIKLYSGRFCADQLSMTFNEPGLAPARVA